MIKLAKATIKATGEQLYYQVKQLWSTLYYSFDDGATWHRSKVKAYETARDSGTLHRVNEVKVEMALHEDSRLHDEYSSCTMNHAQSG